MSNQANHNSQFSTLNSQLKKLSTLNSQLSTKNYLQFFNSCIVFIGSAALNM